MMNRILSVSVLSIALALSASAAQAKVKTSELTSFNIDKKLLQYSPQSQQLSGFVSVDRAKKTASISITKAARCKPMLPCPKYIILALNETLEIVSIEKLRSCGQTVITAREDKLPVDGALKELVITDNSTFDNSKCRTVVALPALTATYHTAIRTKTGLSETNSSFVGKALK